MDSSNVGLLVGLGEGRPVFVNDDSKRQRLIWDLPFLSHLDVGGVALLVLSGLLETLVELLVDGSTTSHQILLDAAQASEDVVDEIEISLLDVMGVTRREGTS